MIEKSPHRRQTDQRGGYPTDGDGRQAQSRADETEEHVDMDMFAAAGGEGSPQHREPPGELGPHAAQVADLLTGFRVPRARPAGVAAEHLPAVGREDQLADGTFGTLDAGNLLVRVRPNPPGWHERRVGIYQMRATVGRATCRWPPAA